MSPKNQATRIIEPDYLLGAYCKGYFPMADPGTGEISWYSPDPRAVFDLDHFRIPRSLKSILKTNRYETAINKDFEQVIRLCAAREETWISEEIVQSYLHLHRIGFAHSVESRSAGNIVGGLYGVAIGGAFFGESMFSAERNASKIALVNLVQRLRENGFELLDTQFITPHLQMFGAEEVPKELYLQKLATAIKKKCMFV
ncbi:MAG: leucyl/phenylalanyl-tRNA--protein transferase [bacterium]